MDTKGPEGDMPGWSGQHCPGSPQRKDGPWFPWAVVAATRQSRPPPGFHGPSWPQRDSPVRPPVSMGRRGRNATGPSAPRCGPRETGRKGACCSRPAEAG